MEGGAVNVYQPGTGGKPGVALGQQYDGTYAPVPLGGPTPPTPSAPSAEGGVERLTVRWGGLFAAGALTVAPQDWSRVEVHVGTSATPDVTFDTLRGTIESPRGGEVSVMGLTPGTDYYVWLVTRSQSGKFSSPSAVVGPVQVTKLGVDDLDLSGIGGNTIYRGDTEPIPPSGGHKVGDLWLQTPDNIAHRWEGDPGSWVPVENARIGQALQDAFDAQQTADAANEAALGAQGAAEAAANVAAGKTTTIRSDTEPPTTDRTVGDEWIETDNGNLRHVWGGSAWVDAPIGNGAIEPNSLVASDVIATGTVSAALLESIMVLATTIVAGDPNGRHARMTPTGFRVFRPDVNGDGVPDEAVRLGTDTGDNLAIVGTNGALLSSLDETGGINGASANIAGTLSVGQPDWTGRGGTLVEMLDRRPRGIVSYGADNGVYPFSTSAGRGAYDITARLFYGRMYVIKVRGRINGEVANDALAELQVRYTLSSVGDANTAPPPPSSPTINSPIAGRFQASVARPEAQGVYFEKLFSLGGTADGSFRDFRFLLNLARPVGATALELYGTGDDTSEMWVEDIGPYITPTKTVNDGGGGVPTAPQVERYTRSWVCTWHQNWGPSGAAVSQPDALQGQSPYYGNMRSYLGFSGVDLQGGGQTMDQALSGAVVESASLYLYSHHWYYNSGGEAVVGMHGYRNPAPSFGGGDEWMVGGSHFTKPGGGWVDLTVPGVDLQRFATGVWKGILLGAATAGSLAYYGRFDAEGTGNSPVLAITFRK